MNTDVARYLRPSELSIALATLAASPRVVLAGGTDLYATGTPMPPKLRQNVLDLTAIERLRGIRVDRAEILVGATTSWADVREADLPVWLRGLIQAAAQVGGVQIQNAATVAGNLCNASPAADGTPPLLALSALIDLASARCNRTVSLEDFVLGPRRTICLAEELVTAVRIPVLSARARSVFYKLGARSSLVISIVSLAVSVDFDANGRICYAGVAVGSCADRARRLKSLESQLLGLTRAAARVVPISEEIPELSPIDDIRATAVYRRDALATLLRRALGEVCGG
ncbi:MAG: FAD binding domain-containing protein [Steroidobacteraceae bacterium]|jgi:CO/xanthine dehydrogenase FAD-binding subunit